MMYVYSFWSSWYIFTPCIVCINLKFLSKLIITYIYIYVIYMYADIYTNLFMLLYEWNKLIKNLNVFNYSPILLLHLANEILDLNLNFF